MDVVCLSFIQRFVKLITRIFELPRIMSHLALLCAEDLLRFFNGNVEPEGADGKDEKHRKRCGITAVLCEKAVTEICYECGNNQIEIRQTVVNRKAFLSVKR